MKKPYKMPRKGALCSDDCRNIPITILDLVLRRDERQNVFRAIVKYV